MNTTMTNEELMAYYKKGRERYVELNVAVQHEIEFLEYQGEEFKKAFEATGKKMEAKLEEQKRLAQIEQKKLVLKEVIKQLGFVNLKIADLEDVMRVDELK